MNKLKITILSLSLITVMSGAAASPALGAITEYFNDVNPFFIKLIITLPSLAIILAAFLYSTFANKVSAKIIAIIGIGLYIIGGA